MASLVQETVQQIHESTDIFQKGELVEACLKDSHASIASLARHLFVSSSYICKLLRLKNVPVIVRDGYYSGLITPTHVYLISRLSHGQQMIEMYEECLSRALPTTQLEERIREIIHGVRSEKHQASDSLRSTIKAKIHMIAPDAHVKIVQTRIRARVTLELRGDQKKTEAFLKALSDSL